MIDKEMDLEEYALGKRQEKKDFFFNMQDVDRVLLMSLRLGAIYPSEVALETLLDIDTVNRILQQAIQNGYMARLQVDKYYPQPPIKTRIFSMWNKGVYGYDSFVRRSWFILTVEGIQYILRKFLGKSTHYHFNRCWSEFYDLEAYNIKLPKEKK